MDLNADLGELPGEAGRRSDVALLDLVTTTHVACGGHAGDDETMRRTALAAAERSVAVGAHPSYPDVEGFGRRRLDMAPADVAAEVSRQLERLGRVCAAEGVALRSAKAHGALYSAMDADPDLAHAVAGAVADFDRRLVLVVAAASPAAQAARAEGLATVAEGFCERGYLADGTLAPRGTPGALVEDPGEAARRAVSLAVRGGVEAGDGSWLALRCQTVCIHGDSPGALAVARRVRRALEDAGLDVAAFTSGPARSAH